MKVASCNESFAREIATEIGRGNRNAESALVTHFTAFVYYLLRRDSISEVAADDLFQECFIVVINRLRTRPLHDPTKLANFIQGIVRRQVITTRRRAFRIVNKSPFIEESDSNTPTLISMIEKSELSAVAQSVLTALPIARDRELLARIYFLDQDSVAIKRDMKLSGSAYRKAHQRALRRAKDVLESAGVTDFNSIT